VEIINSLNCKYKENKNYFKNRKLKLATKIFTPSEKEIENNTQF